MKKSIILILFLSIINAGAEPQMKHESGNVIIVASDASDYYNRKNLQDLKKIRVSLANLSTEETYKKLLKVGGRLFVIVGEAPAMKAYLVTRTSLTQWKEKELFETSVCVIENSDSEEPFIF